MLFSVLTSSAVGLAGLLIAAPVDALVTPGSGSELGHLAARHLAGVSPNHHALARRKSNAHKKRQRCKQRPVSPTSAPAPQQTGTGDNVPVENYVGGGNDNSGSNNNPVNTTPSNPTTTPPATPNYIPPPAVGTNKLMLAWPNGPTDNMDQFFSGKASIYYTWSPHKVNGAPSSVKFCPMLWGWKQLDDFRSLVVPGYADCVLGMNEVNQHDQAAMSVDDGVNMWNTYIGPLQTQGYNILASPATTSAPDGLVWVMDFLEKVWVKPNVITVHWYDVGFPKFKEYVENYYNNTGKRTIWITEFACQNFNGGAQCTEGEIWAFLTEATRWMDGTDWIGAYAPFGYMKQMQGVNELNRLMTDETTPTALGWAFIHGF